VESLELLIEKKQIVKEARVMHKELGDYGDIYRCKGYFEDMDEAVEEDNELT
jgi:hypothetical protein